MGKKRGGSMKRVGVLMAVVFFLNGVVGSSVFAEGEEAERGGAGQIFLSWSGDPKTTQTVTWGDMERSGKFLQYRKAGTESFSKPIEARETEIGEQETFRYEVVLDNLVPGTSYEYRVGAPGQWSGIFSFKTEEEEQASFSAFVLGDVQFNVREEDYAVWGKFLRDAYKEHPETQFALMTGDYVNTANLWRDWNCYLNQAAVFSCIPVMTAPGNHETQYLPFTYLKLFALPENGPEGAAEEFYSFDYAGCHFVSLNSCVLMREREKFMGESAWDDLIDGIDVWLKEDLQKNRKKWNVVFLHHPAYGVDENSRLSEEILRIVHLALFVLRDVVEVKRCHLKHRAGTLAVARCDERRVEIEETTVVEEFVDCISQRVAYAEHRAESVCARTQMSLLAQEFESVSFFLQRISLRIGSAVDFKRFRLHLGSLTLALRLHEFAFYVDARTRCDGFQILVGEFLHIEDNLKVLYCRAVVESHKLHMLVAAARAHPAFHTNVCANQLRRPYF